MLKNRNFFNNLKQCLSAHNSSSGLVNLAISMQYAERNDLLHILEFLHISQDMGTQAKLFSVLAAYLISNGTHGHIIVKFNSIYDKICGILSRGLPQKTNVTLNFITALLYSDEEMSAQRKTLVVYAQNMLRTSGCLSALTNIFTSHSMIHQETWRALCQCMAETCSGMEKNQNYCSYLIPLCIRRCKQGNEYVFQFLQSLINNNERNMQIFCESDGHCLFSREFLKYDQCLQLLNTIILKSNYRTELLGQTNVLYDLQDLKRLYGTSCEVGQWATIILYAIHSNVPVLRSEITKNDKDRNAISIVRNNSSDEISNPPDLNVKKIGNDTSELFQNVIREVLNFEPRLKTNTSRINKSRISIKSDTNNNFNKIKSGLRDFSINSRNLKYASSTRNQRDYSMHSHIKQQNQDESSYIENKIQEMNNLMKAKREFPARSCLNPQERKNKEKTMALNEEVSVFNDAAANTNAQNTTIINFRPTVVSTPKRINKRQNNRPNTPRISKRFSPIKKNYKNRFKDSPMKLNSYSERNVTSNNDRQRSLGGRILNVLNESCASLMKTFKNVFRPKQTETQIKDTVGSENENTDRSHCAHSFMSFMRKRDGFLKERDSELNSNFEEYQNECVTCNDTLCLKEKIKDDEFLRENIKRLKLGINLYGCDFKKISKTLWRHESYMTPSVLYNLYRKLIVK